MPNQRGLIHRLIGAFRSYKLDSPYWFKEVVKDAEHTNRISQVLNIKNYLLRQHKVLQRPNFKFKEEEFKSAKIILNILRSVLNTHISYLIGNPVSLNGNPDVVNKFNRVYKRGNYNAVDYAIVKDLYTFNNAFEYVHLDKDDNIQSKVIANEDAIPVYDIEGNYTHFIEYWNDYLYQNENYVVYYPDKVETYVNDRLVDTRLNLSGLPIHYSGVVKGKCKYFGEPLANDLIPIIDAIEYLVSKMDDGVTVHSLSPIGVVTGKPPYRGRIPKELVGANLHMDSGDDFKYATALLDHQSIKLLLDTLWQQFYAIACVPASQMGQINITNVGETVLRLLYSKMDDKAKETMIALRTGLNQRFDKIRKLLALDRVSFSDEDFDTLNLNFNMNRPIDTHSLMEEIKIQRDMGAISIQTIIDQSPYTIDTVNEMKRLEEERSKNIPVTPTEVIEVVNEALV
jgi:hypothetical protein